MGSIDILVNDFSTRIRRPAVDFPIEEWQQVMDINIRGCFICCKEVGREMVKNGYGKIINHSSVRAQYGFPGGYAAYGSSKGAIDTLTKTLAVEWAPKVRVNAVTAGMIRTEQAHLHYGDEAGIAAVEATVPLGRLGEPRDVGDVCLFLASPLSRYISGASILLHGGGERPAFLEAAKKTSQ